MDDPKEERTVNGIASEGILVSNVCDWTARSRTRHLDYILMEPEAFKTAGTEIG